MSTWNEVRRLPRRVLRRYRKWRLRAGSDQVEYEATWDRYARDWRSRYPGLGHLGDEWTGEAAGAASSLEEYNRLIEDRFISPYIESSDTVLEIGVGGGKTSSLLLKHADRVVCADISAEMLAAARSRLGEERVRYVKLDGRSLSPIGSGSADVCFSFDTMVHIEPRDIFNYLTQIPRVLRGRRLCVLHHGTMLSDLGWRRFLAEWQQNLLGKRHGGAFSVMTDSIMERFLEHLGYEVLIKDTQSIPRDVVWVVRAPASASHP
jgi:ubiquinone/menaquinone biosynthesis C-methylase UbiE